MAVIYKMQVNEPADKDPKLLDEYIAATAEGDMEAFAQLYKATSSAVYAYAFSVLKNSHDAEDVLHDSYLNLYSAADSYESSGKPMAWLMTIAKNLCLRTLQQRRRSSQLPQEDWEPYLESKSELSADDRLTVSACMRQLQEQERKILILHAIAGFKHREIAEFLDIPLATVLSKYARASKKLKIILEKESFQ